MDLEGDSGEEDSAGGKAKGRGATAGGGEAAAPKFKVDATAVGGHNGLDVNCVRWNKRFGELLASVGDDGGLRIWRYRPCYE